MISNNVLGILIGSSELVTVGVAFIPKRRRRLFRAITTTGVVYFFGFTAFFLLTQRYLFTLVAAAGLIFLYLQFFQAMLLPRENVREKAHSPKAKPPGTST